MPRVRQEPRLPFRPRRSLAARARLPKYAIGTFLVMSPLFSIIASLDCQGATSDPAPVLELLARVASSSSMMSSRVTQITLASRAALRSASTLRCFCHAHTKNPTASPPTAMQATAMPALADCESGASGYRMVGVAMVMFRFAEVNELGPLLVASGVEGVEVDDRGVVAVEDIEVAETDREDVLDMLSGAIAEVEVELCDMSANEAEVMVSELWEVSCAASVEIDNGAIGRDDTPPTDTASRTLDNLVVWRGTMLEIEYGEGGEAGDGRGREEWTVTEGGTFSVTWSQADNVLLSHPNLLQSVQRRFRISTRSPDISLPLLPDPL